ncbi:MAG TPA: OB-fold domain-containing protein [Jatrophihabitantaceae bacterium]|jgi:hypothetical protein
MPEHELGVGRPTKRRPGAAVGGLPVADSRPQFADGRIAGSRCVQCRYPSAQRGQPWCPVCYGQLRDETFAPTGSVWSATVIAIPVNVRRPPFGLAYVDLEDGPRVLVHLDEARALPIDAKVRIVGTDLGDLVARTEDGG